MTVEVHTTPGLLLWTCPAGVFFVDIELHGAGERGLSAGFGYDGIGGGGGSWTKKFAVPVTPGVMYFGQVGNGFSSSYSDRTSYLDGDVTGPKAFGGNGGTGGTSTGGDVSHDGGNAGISGGTNDGGGGGGAASPTGNGGDGVNGNGLGTGSQGGTSISAGPGGKGGIYTGSISAVNGTSPGGGGGGTYVTGGSAIVGEGGNGKVILTYTTPNSYTGSYRGGYRVFGTFNTLDIKRGSYAIDPVAIARSERGGYLINEPMGGVFTQRGGYAVNLLSSPMKQRGGYRIYNHVDEKQVGGYRVQNLAVQGYTVYIGVNDLPDLEGTPDAFSSGLPFNIPVTPPVSGQKLLYVVVRKRDSYGMESQNQQYTLITVNSDGSFSMPPVLPPQNLRLILIEQVNIRVLATYDGYGVDPYPADFWKVWYGTSVPDPLVDVPFLTTPVVGTVLTTTIESLSPALYYVMVGLYRSVDTSLVTVYDSIVVDSPPDKVLPVRSGYEEEV